MRENRLHSNRPPLGSCHQPTASGGSRYRPSWYRYDKHVYPLPHLSTSSPLHSLTSTPSPSTPSPLHYLTSPSPLHSLTSPLPQLSTPSPLHSLTSPLPHLSRSPDTAAVSQSPYTTASATGRHCGGRRRRGDY